MFVTGSKDSTMKLWDARLMKMKFDLPGHSDEVFTVDWAPNGDCVASGSFDHSLKMFVTCPPLNDLDHNSDGEDKLDSNSNPTIGGWWDPSGNR
ncbi:hypothetical protein Pelo_9265 [Pelomyxa schiedti]|nr:hypothetical protein Pelo_9265 [Pelomyxa schiedti]